MPVSVKNNAYGRNYELILGNLPNTTFEITSCAIPAISMGVAIQPSTIHDIKIPGDKAEFDPLVVDFIVDEDFASYLEMLNWIQTLRTQARNNGSLKNTMTDAHLNILTNNLTPLKSFLFTGVFPTLLGEVQLGTQQGTEVLVCSATFTYTEFDIVV